MKHNSAAPRRRRRRKAKLPRRYPSRYERNYHNLIRKIVAALSTNARARNDGIEDVHEYILRNLTKSKIKASIDTLAGRVVTTKNKGIADALGFDFFRGDPEMLGLIEKWTNTNVDLVVSVSEDYLGDISAILNDSFIRRESASSVATRISNATGATYKRAKLIARNEMGNLNSSVDLFQAKKLGVREYIWRTSEDERVRGDPSGRYPKATPSHYARQGKTYDIIDGAGGADIHPGVAILCRCTMEMVIEI